MMEKCREACNISMTSMKDIGRMVQMRSQAEPIFVQQRQAMETFLAIDRPHPVGQNGPSIANRRSCRRDDLQTIAARERPYQEHTYCNTSSWLVLEVHVISETTLSFA